MMYGMQCQMLRNKLADKANSLGFQNDRIARVDARINLILVSVLVISDVLSVMLQFKA